MIFVYIGFVVLALIVVCYVLAPPIVRLKRDEYAMFKGKKFDRYIIDWFIGHSDLAVLFEAHDRETNQPILLHVLKEDYLGDLAQVSFLRQFEIRADALKKLGATFRSGVFPLNVRYGRTWVENRNRDFIAHDLVKGIPLDEALRQRDRLSPHDAYTIVKQVAGACALAHKTQMYIREFSPNNIWLSYNSSQGLTATIVSVGIPFRDIVDQDLKNKKQRYYSPEDQKSSMSGVRSDIYGLAVLTYEMLTGRSYSSDDSGAFNDPFTLALKPALSLNTQDRPPSIEAFLILLEPMQNFISKVKNIGWEKFIVRYRKRLRRSKVKPQVQPIIDLEPPKTFKEKFKRGMQNFSAVIVIGISEFLAMVHEKLTKLGEWLTKRLYRLLMLIVACLFILVSFVWYILQFFYPPPPTITIETNPGSAQVHIYKNPSHVKRFIDLNPTYSQDSVLGLTPIDIKKYDPGDYLIRLVKLDYKEVDTSVSLMMRSKFEWKGVVLTGQAKVVLSVTPPTAEVEIDGTRYGSNDLGNILLDEGEHRLSITAPRYLPIKDLRVYLAKGSQALNYELKPDVLKGTLNVNTTAENAMYYINGTQVTCPCDLKEDTYSLKVVAQGYRTRIISVSITAGNTTTVNADLSPVGSVSITSVPPGAEVWFQETLQKNRTPMRIDDLVTGVYNVTLRKPKYLDNTVSFTILHREIIPLAIILKPKTGWVKILPKPVGDVYVNGVLIGKDINQWTLQEVPVDSGRISVHHSVYGRIDSAVVIRWKDTTRVIIEFKKK